MPTNPSTPPGWFDVTDYGAVGDGMADDAPSIRLAIVAAKLLPTEGGGAINGGRVYLPPGIYRCASQILIDGSIIFEGTKGGQVGSTTIVFDQNINTDGLIKIRNVSTDGSGTIGPNTIIRNIHVTQVRNSSRDYSITTRGIKINAGACRVENVSLYYIQGDGIGIDSDDSMNADNWGLGGNIRIIGCDRYGIFVHGLDSNSGSHDGHLAIGQCGSWGIVDQSFLGNS